MARFDAVIFDWMLTLAHYPSPREHIIWALELLGRPVDEDEVASILARREVAIELPDVRAAEAIIDTSAEAHRVGEHLLFERSGIDKELADAMYGLLGNPEFHPLYPDVLDVVSQIHEAGVKIGVVSDIHVDLRVQAEASGLGRFIDGWALSFELGIQKPDHRIFQSVLNQMKVDPTRTLMVGDRASRDGAATELGMTALIIPAPADSNSRRLEAVSALVMN